jgi:hypothetical protein
MIVEFTVFGHHVVMTHWHIIPLLFVALCARVMLWGWG